MTNEQSQKWFFSWVFTTAQGKVLRGSLIHAAEASKDPEQVISDIYNHVSEQCSLPVDGIRAVSFNKV